MKTRITSKTGTLDLLDVGKSALIAGITTAVTLITGSIYAGRFPTLEELKAAAIAGALGAVSYLIKNLFTPAQIITPAAKQPL